MLYLTERVPARNSFRPIFAERELRNAGRPGRVLIALSGPPSATAETIARLAGLDGAR
jgi:hypothetical protein